LAIYHVSAIGPSMSAIGFRLNRSMQRKR